MEAILRLRRPGPYSGHITAGVAQVIFIALAAAFCLGVSSSVATPTPEKSIRAELLHREHTLSPFRSPDTITHAEKFSNAVQRSAMRSRRISERQLGGRNQAKASTVEANASTVVTSDYYGGNTAEEYLMTISLGTPPQNFVVIVDTGSDLAWVQCAPCIDCFNQSSPVFSPSISSTYSQLPCASTACNQFSSLNVNLTCFDYSKTTDTLIYYNYSGSCSYFYEYGDQSYTEGNFSTDTITLRSTSGENVTVPDFWFGCSQIADDQFQQSDGLVGFGQGSISFPTQLGHDFEDKFSYCLVNQSLATVQSSLLVFGEDPVSALFSGALQYTAILSNPRPRLSSFYYVGWEGITVDGVPLNFSATDVAIDGEGNGGIIFDSGTYITTLTPVAYDPLLAVIAAKVPDSYTPSDSSVDQYEGLDLCYNITGIPETDYQNALPSISFKFANNSSWDLRFENSWFVDEEAGVAIVCLAFAAGNITEGGPSIFGNFQMQDYYMQYDRVNKRIGFAAVDCASVSP